MSESSVISSEVPAERKAVRHDLNEKPAPENKEKYEEDMQGGSNFAMYYLSSKALEKLKALMQVSFPDKNEITADNIYPTQNSTHHMDSISNNSDSSGEYMESFDNGFSKNNYKSTENETFVEIPLDEISFAEIPDSGKEITDNDYHKDNKKSSTNKSFVEMPLHERNFIKIPTGDKAEQSGNKNDDKNNENIILEIPESANEDTKTEQDSSPNQSQPTKYSTAWVVITWIFTISLVIIIFCSFFALAYLFTKGKKVYAQSEDPKIKYMRMNNMTEEDYEIFINNNRTLARSRYPVNPYLWLPDPPSAKILG